MNTPRELVEKVFGFLRRESGLIWTSAGNVASSVLGALIWLILASILKVAEYGEVNYFIAISFIIAALGSLGLNITVTTYLAKGEKRLVDEANSIVLLSSVVVAATVIPTFRRMWFLAPTAIAIMFFWMSMAELLGAKRYREYAYVMAGYRVVQIALMILLYLKLGLIGIIVGYLTGYLCLSYRFFKSLSQFTRSVRSLRGKFGFILHSYGLNVVTNLTTFLDKVIVGSVYGFYMLGLYQLGYQFLMFLSTIPVSLFAYLLPEESSGERRREAKIIGFTLALAAAVVTYVIAPWIIVNFFPNFTEAIGVVRIMCIAVIPAAVVNILNAMFFGRERSAVAFTGGILYLASLVTCLLLLGRVFGIVGLASSVIISQTAQALYLAGGLKLSERGGG
ncbi:MAG: hypothetical protein DRN03_03355 [Thermoplasmata archaeon]|nr:MAG: hypothetical protein DRN03_03355 [Thermoplasmata archaeon]